MEMITTYICKAFDIGINSNMFGGAIMSLIDDSAASFAAQLCDTPNLVTVKFDGLIFDKPIKSGSVLKVFGKVVRFGKSSVELYIEVRKHNVYTGEQRLVTHTNVTMVRVDEDGKSIPISDLAKERYYQRITTFGKALLSQEELNKGIKISLS